MSNPSIRHGTRSRARVAVGLSFLLALNGCGLDEVEVPDLDGPSSFGLNLRLTANPDVITADGFSTSVIRATLRDSAGRPVAGRAIFFAIADEDGLFADIGTLSSDRATTDGSGVAQVVYEAPSRTDATAHQSVLIAARPIGDDFGGQIYRTVRIELRSAEPRLFPQRPICGVVGAPAAPACNAPPVCSFAVQAPSGFRPNVGILFQSTSADPDGTIVRYAWDFGNGRRADNPDVSTVYFSAGTFTVTHTVTDDDGAQSACAAILAIN